MPLYDLSIPIHSGMIVWPGDLAVSVQRRSSIPGGDAINRARGGAAWVRLPDGSPPVIEPWEWV